MIYAQDFFKGLKPENNVEGNTVRTTADPTLESLTQGFSQILEYAVAEHHNCCTPFMYNQLVKTQVYHVSNDDITRFCLLMGSTVYRDEDTTSRTLGAFVSYLCNTSPDTILRLDTSCLLHVEGLGYKNTKDLTIIGNSGQDVGEANVGTITVFGDVGRRPGFHNQGILTAHGNAGRYTGIGNAGTIYLNGDHYALDTEKSVPHFGTGDMYHKGTLIVRKGELIGDPKK